MDPTTSTIQDGIPPSDPSGGQGSPPQRPVQPGGPDGPGSRPGSRSKTLAWVAAAVIVALVVIFAVVLAWPRHQKKVNHLNLPASQAIVSAGGRQLVSLLQTGESATFHATYRVTGASPGGVQSLEIWQSPPRVREDTVASANGHTARTASFSENSTTHLCVQQDGGPWTCTRAAVDPNNLIATIAGSVAGQSVAVTQTTIDNRKVQCFQVASGPQLCATSAGIPVLIAGGSVRYELASLTSSVSSSDLNPPASDSR